MKNRNIRFLLIDDDEDDREFFEISLNEVEQKIDFVYAESGRVALELLKSRTSIPDCIFLDLNMPQMSGREFLQELKENSELSYIPVIIFSTSSDPRDIQETKELGAIAFITKSPRTIELTKILNKFILDQIQNTIHS